MYNILLVLLHLCFYNLQFLNHKGHRDYNELNKQSYQH
jgi:hypothetical protein